MRLSLMGLIDFILNLACLLLWLNWRTSGFDPLAGATPATLAGTLRRAGNHRLKRWQPPALLAGLILLRALFYWQIGSAVRWTATLNLGAVALSFRSDLFSRILLFSVLSFAGTLAIFFLALLLISLLRPRTLGADLLQRLARRHLGWVDRWPRWVKFLLPLLVGAGLWWVASWPLVSWGMVPPPVSAAHRAEQALVIGLCTYLPWKIPIAVLLILHLANAYIYFGSHPLWLSINGSAQVLLAPLRPVPLRVGKVDFAPLVGLVILFAFDAFVVWGIGKLYTRLPF